MKRTRKRCSFQWNENHPISPTQQHQKARVNSATVSIHNKRHQTTQNAYQSNEQIVRCSTQPTPLACAHATALKNTISRFVYPRRWPCHGAQTLSGQCASRDKRASIHSPEAWDLQTHGNNNIQRIEWGAVINNRII